MGRVEFIGWSVFLIVYWIPSYLIGVFADEILPLNFPFALILLIYWFSLLVFSAISIVFTIRRLHDINRSGFWYLLNLVPFIGYILLFIWTVLTPGTQGSNRFGPSPIDPDTEIVEVFGEQDAEPPAPVQQQQSVTDINEYELPCPQCGTMNALKEVKCTSCGTRV